MVLCCAIALSAGCSDGSDGDTKDEPDTETDTGGPRFQPLDTKIGDDTSGSTSQDAGSTSSDDAGDTPKDAGGPKGGAFGAICNANGDCDSGHCIFTPKGLRCTDECVDSCKGDFSCETMSGKKLCVPKYGHICEPCTSNDACFAHGQTKAACVSMGDAGAFCGIACGSDTQCPTGHKCNNVNDIDGNSVQQCVPETGICACTPWATDKKLSTACKVTVGTGSCTGKRTCLADGATGAPPGGGLTACDAPKPATEACDVKDNDCDGQTDEDTCDDNELCTTDSCAGTAGCNHVNKTGSCDADGSECTAGDACKDGKCAPGTKLACDDKNPCTVDTCDAAKGCVFKNTAAPCNADDNPCTVADTCKDGVCNKGNAKPCASGQPCVAGACSIVTGKCKFTDKDGLPCNDGDACSVQEACKGETCKGKPLGCNDGKDCTIDSCDKVKGCDHKPRTGACSDGNKCTKADECVAGTCVGLSIAVTKDCNDGSVCTLDGCNKQTGCTHTPQAGACTDGNACTQGDACKNGKCEPGANECKCQANADCDDKNVCTDDSCTKTGKKVCKNEPIDKLACDADGSVCTVGDVCIGTKCTAGSTKKCDDGNGCTADSCDPKQGCKYNAKSGSCDDGDPCTVGDVCVFIGAGKVSCKAGKPNNCDDSVACTVDSCDAKSGGCKNVSAVGKAVGCYSGPLKTKGVGACKAGTQTCKVDGTLTPCSGQVLPAAKDACGNGKDDDCNGTTDQGCAPTGFGGRMTAATLQGQAGKVHARGSVGGALVSGRLKGAKFTVDLGLYRWLGTF